MKGYTYILKCADDSYYTGSTKDLDRRLKEHQNGEGAKHTAARLPVVLVYSEEYDRIDEAFKREKQIQKWSRAKKEALMHNRIEELKELAKCKNNTHSKPGLSTLSESNTNIKSVLGDRAESNTNIKSVLGDRAESNTNIESVLGDRAEPRS